MVTVTAPRAGMKIAVQLITTSVFVLTVGAAVDSGSLFASLAIGAVLMLMIYSGGHRSMAYYNPAVTLSVLVRAKIGLGTAAGYRIVQLGVGLIVAVVVRGFVDPAQAITLSAFVVEVLFTLTLSYVVLKVATSGSYPDSSFHGLVIGFTVVAGGFAVGAVSGGAFNLLVALVALGAGVAAGFAFLALEPAHT